ncbi:Interleukin-1 alpha, partial [Manis javanica]
KPVLSILCQRGAWSSRVKKANISLYLELEFGKMLNESNLRRGSEVKMAKVPDLFEDLKHCYSENEDYSSEIDHLSLNQKSFYDANYDPLHEDCRDKFKSLSTSETSASSEITFSESMVVVTASGKVLKKRRLSLNQFITNDDLEAIASDTEEEIIKPRSAPYTFQNNVKYNFMRVIKSQFILNDVLNQSIVRVTWGPYLSVTALQNMENAGDA